MPDRYQFSYGQDTVYTKVVELVSEYRLDGGDIVVDVGCGFGAIAEPIRELGLGYLGLDIDVDGLKDLGDRGFETAQIDLADPDATVDTVRDQIAGRRLAAIVTIDLLEHITNGEDVLRSLHRLSGRHGGCPLVVAVPNVTHFDLAAKLLLGRWDVTPTGLLDDTHVTFYSAKGLHDVTNRSGWVHVGSRDFEMLASDQHFPEDLAVLTPGTPLRDLLLQVRSQASEGAVVNEFVRAYAPLATVARPEPPDGSAPFLSILVRTQGRRMTMLEETLLSLAAQTCQDFEVLLLVHDVPRSELGRYHDMVGMFDSEFSRLVKITPVEGGGRAHPLNVGAQLARGRYVAALDDDDLAFGSWVESFIVLAEHNAGKVLRSMVAEQPVKAAKWGEREAYTVTGGPNGRWPERFNVLTHLIENSSPFCGFAVPRTCFSELGLSFDENLPVVEDWDLLLRAGLWCGVADSGEISSLYRRWESRHSSLHIHSEQEWRRSRDMVLAKLDQRPLLLPPQSVSAIHDLHDAVSLLRAQLGHASQERDQLAMAAAESGRQLEEIRASGSWQVTGPARVLGSVARRLLRRFR